jgi:transposase InsO family protein
MSRDLDRSARHRGVKLDVSRPGNLTDNAFTDAFIGRFRAGRRTSHWFPSPADDRETMRNWR